MEKQRWIYQQDSAVSNGNVSNFLRPSPLHSSLATLLSRVVALLLASSQIITSQLAFLSKLDLPLPGLSLSPLPTERDSDQRTAYLRKKKREKKERKTRFFSFNAVHPFLKFYIPLLYRSPFLLSLSFLFFSFSPPPRGQFFTRTFSSLR